MKKTDELIIEWLTTLGLYDKVKMPERDAIQAIYGIDEFDGTFDQFCPECRSNSTFTALKSAATSTRAIFKALSYGQEDDGKDLLKYSICARNSQHAALSLFVLHQDGFTKVGQYPSQADVAKGDVQRYSSVLSPQDLGDLGRAIGLYAHGIGAGAFIYLRRIFESLVEKAHIVAKNVLPDWDETAYIKMRMGERIKALSGYLPGPLVEHHSLYGILSDHIHNQSEEVCKKNFGLVLEGIYLIADEKLAEKSKAKRAEAFAKAKTELTGGRKQGVG
jgi:hypothetical protein